jgi:hypothetical protein
LALVFCSCGYVGDPLPPALNIPERVTDLRVHQRGDRLVAEFTIPAHTTEGLGLRLGHIELRVGPGNGPHFDEASWYASASRWDVPCAKAGPCRVEAPASLWAGREVFCRVRLAHKKGRWSDWSDFAILQVVPPLGVPQNLRAESAPEGVVLSWEDPDRRAGKTYRIYRKQDKQPLPAVAATSPEPRWVDRTAEFGRTYEYAVEAVLVTGNSEARSERTAPVAITPLDRFPPEVPSGLVAVAGPASIELSWDPNRDPDLAGYFVWRAAEDGPFERISGLLGAPSFSDARVERGRRYRYAISAADRLGNESRRSAPAEAELP